MTRPIASRHAHQYGTGMTGQLLKRAGQPDLHTEVHHPAGEARALVLVNHGFDEQCGRYAHVIQAWLERGIAVVLYDLRGHGRSGGTPGHVEAFRDYVRDAEDVLAEAVKDERLERLGRPVVFGHSLGGLISLHVALAHPERYRKVVLCSPFLGLALPVSSIERALGRFIVRLVPTLKQGAKISGDMVTHDPALARAYDEDTSRSGKVSLRWFFEVEAAQQHLDAALASFDLPLYIRAAGDDKLVSIAATRRLFDVVRSPSKKLDVIDGRYHELLNETDRDEHIAAFADAMCEGT